MPNIADPDSPAAESLADYRRLVRQVTASAASREAYRKGAEGPVARALRERRPAAPPAEEQEATADLPEGRLACADCGQAAPEGAPVVSRTVLSRRPETVELLLSRCPSCDERRALAEKLMPSRPGVIHRFGSVEHLHEALCALEAVGRSFAPGDSSSELLRAFQGQRDDGCSYRAAARAVRWGSHDNLRGLVGKCAPRPWAHVPDDVRGVLREASARLLAVRVAADAPPVDLAPSTGSGCLLCGCASVRMSAVDVVRRGGPEEARRAVWTDRRRTGVTGSLCGPCADASSQENGTVGPAAAERACLEHVRREDGARAGLLRIRLKDRTLTVRPWYETGAAPSRRPWSHVPSE